MENALVLFGWQPPTALVAAACGAALAALPVALGRALMHGYIFRFKGHMRDGKPSLATHIWRFAYAICNRIFPAPRLLTCERLLARQPVPPLRATVERYLVSLRPLLSDVSEMSVCIIGSNPCKLTGKISRARRESQLFSRLRKSAASTARRRTFVAQIELCDATLGEICISCEERRLVDQHEHLFAVRNEAAARLYAGYFCSSSDGNEQIKTNVCRRRVRLIARF